MVLLNDHRNTLRKISLTRVTVYSPNGGPWQSLLEMVRDRCVKVENLCILSCYALHLSACGTSYSSKYVRFEDSGGRLSSGRHVVRPSFGRLIREVREGGLGWRGPS